MTEQGQAINVDGDRAAAITAAQLSADDLIILSNVPGVLKNIDDAGSRIDSICRNQLQEVTESYAQGRMKIKLLAAGSAIDGGVSRVIIGDARPERCIANALAGNATTITA